MLCKLIIAIAFCNLEYSALSNAKQIGYQSNNADTIPTLRIAGLGVKNVTFTWTKVGVWKDVDDFTVSLLTRKGAYRPIEVNASFNLFDDILKNYTRNRPNYLCKEDFCVCSFKGYLGRWGEYYKSCSDGVVIVQAKNHSLSANFTTAPSRNFGLSTKIDGNNLIVRWNGFKETDDVRCGRQVLLNIYQRSVNLGFTPVGWYYPGSNFYGNILHQMIISADTKWETEYSFPLDPELVTDDIRTQSTSTVLAYMYGDLVTNTWTFTQMNYGGDSKSPAASPAASISAVTIAVASLLSLTFI